MDNALEIETTDYIQKFRNEFKNFSCEDGILNNESYSKFVNDILKNNSLLNSINFYNIPMNIPLDIRRYLNPEISDIKLYQISGRFTILYEIINAHRGNPINVLETIKEQIGSKISDFILNGNLSSMFHPTKKVCPGYLDLITTNFLDGCGFNFIQGDLKTLKQMIPAYNEHLNYYGDVVYTENSTKDFVYICNPCMADEVFSFVIDNTNRFENPTDKILFSHSMSKDQIVFTNPKNITLGISRDIRLSIYGEVDDRFGIKYSINLGWKINNEVLASKIRIGME